MAKRGGRRSSVRSKTVRRATKSTKTRSSKPKPKVARKRAAKKTNKRSKPVSKRTRTKKSPAKTSKATPQKEINLLDKIWMSSLQPMNFFSKIKKESLRETVLFFVLVPVLIHSIWKFWYIMMKAQNLYPTLYLGFETLFGPDFYSELQIAFTIGTIAVILLFTLLVHIFVKLFGGKSQVLDTFRVIIYGSTPHALLGWISPLLFGVWTLVLWCAGIKKTNKFHTWTAVAVVGGTLVVWIALSAFGFHHLFSSYVRAISFR